MPTTLKEQMEQQRQERIRELRIEAAKVGCIVTSEAFWEVAANAIRRISELPNIT